MKEASKTKGGIVYVDTWAWYVSGVCSWRTGLLSGKIACTKAALPEQVLYTGSGCGRCRICIRSSGVVCNRSSGAFLWYNLTERIYDDLLLQRRFYRLLPSVKEGRRSGIYVSGAGSWYLYRAGCSRQRSGSSVWSESASRLMYGFYAVSWRSRNEWFLRTASGAGIRSCRRNYSCLGIRYIWSGIRQYDGWSYRPCPCWETPSEINRSRGRQCSWRSSIADRRSEIHHRGCIPCSCNRCWYLHFRVL